MRPLKRRAKRLGEVLLQDGAIDEAQLRLALERQKRTGEFLGEALFAMGLVSAQNLGDYLEQETGFPFVDLAQASVDLSEARKIPENLARKKQVFPYRRENGKVLVAMADPLNLTTVDEVRALLGASIEVHLAFAADIESFVSRAFSVGHKAETMLAEIAPTGQSDELTFDKLLDLAEDAPIVRLVNSIIGGALSQGASDIHVEPGEVNLRVRYRLDGLLYEEMTIPLQHLAAIVSRLKIMANLDIAERRRPQDGGFKTKNEKGEPYDVRLSIMPTIYGEKAVMRLLEHAAAHNTLDKLGFFPEQLRAFEKFVTRAHGIVLVTGPTGSGKSTSLYAALQSINDSTLNINTIEDPVEYKTPGVNHTQVNPKIGVTFAAGLRTLVRQDPDVILVGEIRDAETAEIAVQAALTGHLVLSTLHTNDAPGALVRLQNMGIPPFLISSAVVGVVGQRLLRLVCPTCRETYDAPREMLESLGIAAEGSGTLRVARGKGCARCGKRGTKGRTAVYEVMPMTEKIRELVLRRASGSELMEEAQSEGMLTMRQAAAIKVRELTVSPEEALRVLSAED